MTENRHWWRDAVVYQVYLRSFADGDGDGTGDAEGDGEGAGEAERGAEGDGEGSGDGERAVAGFAVARSKLTWREAPSIYEPRFGL